MSRVNSNGRKPSGNWAEVVKLHRKLLYWLYGRQDRPKARKLCVPLGSLLEMLDPNQEATLGQECRSLIGEAKGNLRKAIQHREREIALIKKLWKVSAGTPGQKYALQGYQPADLADRLDLLAILYHDAGKIRLAIRMLRQSKRVCDKHGLPFDGAELLADYQEEQSGSRKRPLKAKKPA